MNAKHWNWPKFHRWEKVCSCFWLVRSFPSETTVLMRHWISLNIFWPLDIGWVSVAKINMLWNKHLGQLTSIQNYRPQFIEILLFQTGLSILRCAQSAYFTDRMNKWMTKNDKYYSESFICHNTKETRESLSCCSLLFCERRTGACTHTYTHCLKRRILSKNIKKTNEWVTRKKKTCDKHTKSHQKRYSLIC